VSSPATNSRPREITASRERVWRRPLRSGGERARFLALGLALFLLYSALTAGDYASKVLAATLRASNVELAVRMQPMNAAFHHLLGRLAFFERQDFPAALAHYRRATQLNRYSARYWLDLANTQQIMGLPGESRASLAKALAADPTNPRVASEAANYYLVLGDIPAALKLLGVTVRHSPGEARNAVELSWRATQDPAVVMGQVLPQTPEGYLLLLQVLMERQETGAAARVWDGLLSLDQAIAPESGFPYIEYLLQQGEVAPAKAAWDRLMRRDDSTRGYLAGGNLVSNGGFEEEILNGGFGWRYQSDPHVALSIDGREAYGGSRSLSIGFDGTPEKDAGIYQLLAIEPATGYRISARMKCEAIEGAGGPQLAVLDGSSRKPLFLSAECTGTRQWQAVTGEFRTEPGSRLVMLRVVRVPGRTLVRGRLWIDDIAVERK